MFHHRRDRQEQEEAEGEERERDVSSFAEQEAQNEKYVRFYL